MTKVSPRIVDAHGEHWDAFNAANEDGSVTEVYLPIGRGLSALGVGQVLVAAPEWKWPGYPNRDLEQRRNTK